MQYEGSAQVDLRVVSAMHESHVAVVTDEIANSASKEQQFEEPVRFPIRDLFALHFTELLLEVRPGELLSVQILQGSDRILRRLSPALVTGELILDGIYKVFR